MRQLRRTGATGVTPAGYARHGRVYPVANDMAERLLADGGWEDVTRPAKARLTEVPTPTPAKKPAAPRAAADDAPDGKTKPARASKRARK